MKKNAKYQRPLRTGEVSRYCNVGYSTVTKWIKSGGLKAHRKPGGHYKIHKDDLIDFLRKGDRPVPATKH